MLLLSDGKEHEVELLAADQENRQYLTTPWPSYPPCGLECLIVISPTGQIHKVLPRHQATNWAEALTIDEYKPYTTSGYRVVRYPVVKGNTDRVKFSSFNPTAKQIEDFEVRLKVVRQEEITIAAGKFNAWYIENVLMPPSRSWETVRKSWLDPELNLIIKWDGGRGSGWELKRAIME